MFNLNKPTSANAVGVGLRHIHHQYILEKKPPVPWLEVHSENFFSSGGAAINFIKKVRQHYPLSLHGVGLSLGSATKIHKKHLQNLKKLIAITEPFLVSDHISWSNVEDRVLNDLLPIPYTKESLKILCGNISQTQDFLKREILVENPSTYLSFINSQIAEDEFINQTAKITGCKILLDINNIYVSSTNNGFDAKKYLQNIDAKIVGEMHLAGHSVRKFGKQKMLVDTHDNFVCDAVWDLYKIAVSKFKTSPTLIEWDQDIPEFSVLMAEAKKAEKIIKHQL
ncbi:MAG: DUF692 domain-containing protein [Pseudomonadota bacterium]